MLNFKNEHITDTEPSVGSLFAGCTIVVTGTLENYTRSSINDRIEELGAKPGKSVSGKTDYVVYGDKAGSKLTKAQELGIKVLTEEEFEAMASA